MLRLTPLPKLARNSETGGAQGDIIDTIFFTESEHHCSNSLFCCSTMYSGNGSFYRIRIVQSFVKTISEQSLVRGGVARLPQGEIFLRKNQTLTLNLSLLNMTDHFRISENSANIMILQPIHLFTPGMLPSAKLRSLRDF